MRHHLPLLPLMLAVWGLVVIAVSPAQAQTQRARPPQFDDAVTSRIFFSEMSTAFRGDRPTLSSLRELHAATAIAQSEAAATEDSAASGHGWNKLISPLSLEDEVKRVKLKFDAGLTTPGAFNSGGYQDARLNLSILASLFAVISEYSGDVRWKSDAKTARDLVAKTARNCAAGSTPVFNEAQLRKADLQDLVSGAGLTAAKTSDQENDWSMIVDRSPLMEYCQLLVDQLSDQSNDAATAAENVDKLRKNAELLAMVGEVLTKDGMDDSEDDDYATLSHEMSTAALSVVSAIERQDFEAVRGGVGKITQSCANCHEQYR
ncbi:cytochrome c [Allorhodopirellula heiligendammensis]|uniref:Cytochrome C n=1 Tax=Allorhodopirellula heiligendammensis TaxID=2714739 RepID=A0A5C6BGP3_9BACT|nr:cytochrome c [Allorhodopirellula heiligendammensis]TWU10439.1 hypothetical protein Poly21_43430 [Allorhodopirellula heiligendammensis]